MLDAGEVPDIVAPDPAQLPTVNVRLSSLQGYEALIDARDLEDAA